MRSALRIIAQSSSRPAAGIVALLETALEGLDALGESHAAAHIDQALRLLSQELEGEWEQEFADIVARQ